MSRCPGARMREGGAEWLEAEPGPCPRPQHVHSTSGLGGGQMFLQQRG